VPCCENEAVPTLQKHKQLAAGKFRDKTTHYRCKEQMGSQSE